MPHFFDDERAICRTELPPQPLGTILGPSSREVAGSPARFPSLPPPISTREIFKRRRRRALVSDGPCQQNPRLSTMDPIGTFAPQKRPGDNSADQQQRRKRARQSCETCKARKTKCVGLESGTCQYCAQLGLSCHVNLRARKRPFYRISEAAYESSIALLRRFVSEEELPELTVEGIQGVLSKLGETAGDKDRMDANAPVHVDSQSPASLSASAAGPHPSPQSQTNGGRRPPAPIEEQRDGSGLDLGAEEEEVMEPDEHPALQEERGCMVLDSLGKYRYVGADSSIRWNHAARMALHATAVTDPKVIAPLKTGLLPPKTPESLGGSSRGAGVYLPPATMAMRYAGYFFQEVHCLYWFYSLEQFYGALEETLEDHGAKASASWLCSLYSIFAIGSMAPENQVARAGKEAEEGDKKRAPEYLALAKDLVPEVSEEADTESVKAFGLLSLGMHAMCYSVGAYLHLGTAVRIGFSLGLHRNILPRKSNSVGRERARRLWWTIYTLDHEMAIRFGYPCAVGDESGLVKTPAALEQVMDPGPNMPLGYQALCVSLVRLRKKIGQSCFVVPAQAGGRLPIRQVFDSLNALRAWVDEIPHYLSREASQPPQHRRPVSILHLRYLSSVIFVTRPFLLYTVSRPSGVKESSKAQCYEEISRRCIEAAEQSVDLFKRMVEDRTLSSRILFDCHCLGETMWILILAVQKLGQERHRQMLQLCLKMLRGMEQFGWCEKVAPELEARLLESGIMQPQSRRGTQRTQQTQQDRDQSVNLQSQENGPGVAFGGMPPDSRRDFLEDTTFNFDISEFDLLETLDMDGDDGSGWMDMLADGTLSASQLGF
ncbi:Zn(II)2Cys6 transcription factor [Aspergillus lucknowensis]|uniref:Fungal-specific transcription factor domain-containing protein n=1 Tax=Aspergillus lucknowensis TaxID=176173 RepID=A0ABR4L9I4_9EURO